jgi:hypothetical protein
MNNKEKFMAEQKLVSKKMQDFARKAFDISTYMASVPPLIGVAVVACPAEIQTPIVSLFNQLNIGDLLVISVTAGFAGASMSGLVYAASHPMSWLKIDGPS